MAIKTLAAVAGTLAIIVVLFFIGRPTPAVYFMRGGGLGSGSRSLAASK